MNCLVTAGPTYEPIDSVRRLTNFSTGSLGTGLAAYLSNQGAKVTLLRGSLATHRCEPEGCVVREFTTTDDLSAKLKEFRGQAIDAIFHVAAVNDFTVSRVLHSGSGSTTEVQKVGKLDSRSGSLLLELSPTEKIIKRLREWFPQAFIVGWKYEVDGEQADVIAKARRQIEECDTNGCVANGPAYGEGFGWVQRGLDVTQTTDPNHLFRTLVGALRRR